MADDIKLTLNPFGSEDQQITEAVEDAAQAATQALAEAEAEAEKKVQQDTLDMQNFSEAEQQMIDDFSKQIDVKDANLVFSYGAAAQQNISQFSDAALKNVRTKDLDEVGDMISNLVVELKSFNTDEEDKGGLFGLFKKKARSLEVMKAQYDKTEVNVNKITEGLEQHQIQLLKDIAMLDKLYDQNLSYFKELSMYIVAGKKRLEDFRANELQEARDKAEAVRPRVDPQHLHPDGAPDPPDPVLQPADGREDPDLAGEHHPAVEEPDGAGDGPGPHRGRHEGPARRH